MLNCGAVMLPKGFTLLIPLIAVWTAEFAVVTSFWIDVRRELKVLVRKVLIWRGLSDDLLFKNQPDALLV